MSARHVSPVVVALLSLILGAAPPVSVRSEERSMVRIEIVPADEVIVTGRRQYLPGLREIQEYNAAELAALRRRYVTPVRKPRAFEADVRVSTLPEHALLAGLIAESTPLREIFSPGLPR